MSNSNKSNTTNKNTKKAVKKTAKKVVKKVAKTKQGKIIMAIALVLVVIFVLTYYFYPPFNKFVNDVISTVFEDGTKNNSNNSYNNNINKTIVQRTELKDTVIHFIDVGQGDCIFIELPDDKYCLIDASDNKTYIKQAIINYLTALEVTQIDYLIATHTDADHIGGMGAVFENFEIKKVFRPYVKYTGTKYTFSAEFNTCNSSLKIDNDTYGNFLNYILNEKYHDENNIEQSCEWVYFNTDSDFSGIVKVNNVNYDYNFDFLTPSKPVEQISYKKPNGYSPIIKFSYMGFDVMFTGDAEQEAEAEFVSVYTSYSDYVDVDLLKVGHHGSASTSSSNAFLDLIKPEYAVISCGVDNRYEHPDKETLDKLFERNIALYRTDMQGNIVFSINGSGVATPTIQKTDYEGDVYKKLNLKNQ